MGIKNKGYFKVTCLITCLLLYWSKIHRIFFISHYIILILIIYVLQIFFELTLNLWHWRGPPYVAETFALLSFWVFLYRIVKISIEENKICPLRGHILIARSSLRSQLWARLGRAIRSSRFALGLVLFAYV